MLQRCFIALEPPAPVEKCLRERLAAFSTNPQVKWVPPQNLHLTMLFLGDTESSLIPDIATAMQQRASEYEAPQLSLRGLELFPSREPRMVWASLVSQGDAVFVLRKSLLKDARAIGCQPDAKPLKLHITLGRMKAQLPAWLQDGIITSPVDSAFLDYERLTLYRSVSRPEGPTYHILHQVIINTRR